MSLQYIYENAIASRPATRQLLNEITNSNKNVEEFKKVYCPWFPFGDIREQGWRWSWPKGPGSIVDPDRVTNYAELFKKKKYPPPNRIPLHTPKNMDSSFANVFIYSLPNQLLTLGEQWEHEYQILLTDLVAKAKEQKIAADFLHNAVINKVGNPNTVGQVAWWVEAQETPNRDQYKVRYVLDDLIIHFIIIFFMRVQRLLPQRDIFKYGSVLDLLNALNSATSNRQKKSTKSAEVKEKIPGLVYEDDNLLVVEPQTWEFSRRYFGAPTRYSLVTPNKLIKGATWCTAASDQTHWHKYIISQQNHLYYFIQKSTDQLFAIRTAGGGNESVKSSHARLLRSTLDQEHAAYLYSALRSGLIAESEAVSQMHNKVQKIIDYAKNAQHYMRQINEEEFERIITLAKELKIFNYKAYTEYFTMEARDQENKMISTSKVYDTFGISEEWIRKNLKFFDILDQ